MNSNVSKIFICFLPKFHEMEYSDEIFDYMKPFILVAFPPLTLDHLLKTARKETNKHSSFIIKHDNQTCSKQSVFHPESNHVILTRHTVGITQPSRMHLPQNICWYYWYCNYYKEKVERGNLGLSELSESWGMLAWPVRWLFSAAVYQSTRVNIGTKGLERADCRPTAFLASSPRFSEYE